MFCLTASATQQPDYVALAMVLVLALIVAIMALKKYLSRKHPRPAVIPAAPAAPVVPAAAPVPAPGTAGQIKLHDVPPKTAAMLMAIVADKTGKPLNTLRFISIKEVKENEI